MSQTIIDLNHLILSKGQYINGELVIPNTPEITILREAILNLENKNK